ncbi:MAG: undecaprenyl-diphosphate phosphatase [Candidatus Dojkabacteria bacterium]|nr:undecaprenyl-diphosphate phosphatase [Candidatus Dojkabacteria bacterium]
MGIIEYAVLGIIQGLTEFIPVSSSAHLDIIPKMLGWNNPSTVFDTFLHLGTLIALLIFYRGKIKKYFVSTFKSVFKKSKQTEEDRKNIKIILLILSASIPALVTGLVYNQFISDFYDSAENDHVTNILILSSMFLLGCIFIIYPKFLKKKKVDLYKFTILKSFLTGVFQIFAFFRGISRSGITIISAQFLGLKRVDAAEFSFLMSIPVISATSLYSVYKILSSNEITQTQEELTYYVIGMVCALLSGIFAIKFLLSFLSKYSLALFGYYRIVFAIICFLILTST